MENTVTFIFIILYL